VLGMPSRTKGWSADQYPHLQLEELTALSNDVCECVAEEQWEQLVVALDLRQRCLETLFENTAADREALKTLANLIIEEDAALVEKIQGQKKILEKQIRAFDKGRQGIRAYSST